MTLVWWWCRQPRNFCVDCVQRRVDCAALPLFLCGVGVGVMGGESGDVVVVDELADVELDSVGCVSVSDSDKFDCSSMLFVELQ